MPETRTPYEQLIYEQFGQGSLDYMTEMIRVMQEVGTPPELIYAFRVTGRVLTEKGLRNLSKADLHEWDEAVAEYRKAHP